MEQINELRNLDYINNDDEDCLNEESSLYRSLDGVTPEAICQVDDDVKYRAMAFANKPTSANTHQEYYNNKYESYNSPSANLLSSKTNNLQIEKTQQSNILEHSSSSNMVSKTQESSNLKSKVTYLPEKPSVLMKTHVFCNMRIDIIRDQIKKILDNRSEVSYEFDASSHKWSGVYVCGTRHCKFEIQIYSNTPSNDYIVELNRTKGEHCVFYKVYGDIEAALSTNHQVDVHNATSFVNNQHEGKLDIAPSTPQLASSNEMSLTDDEANEALQPIITMAKMESKELNLEASKIFHELSCRDDIKEQLRESGCVDVLAELITNSSCDCTRRNAALALTNLSESPSCQDAIVNSGVVPTLFSLIINGPYQTCETRRACARLLANLSTRLSIQIAKHVGVDKLNEWMHSIDNISDSKLRVHANRARLSLQEAVLAL